LYRAADDGSELDAGVAVEELVRLESLATERIREDVPSRSLLARRLLEVFDARGLVLAAHREGRLAFRARQWRRAGDAFERALAGPADAARPWIYELLAICRENERDRDGYARAVLEWYGTFETEQLRPELVDRYVEVLREQRGAIDEAIDEEGFAAALSEDSRVIVDVGCHNGNDTHYYLRKGFSVIAFEPDPVQVEGLRLRFHEEIREKRLLLYPYAASDEDGTATLFVPAAGAIRASLTPLGTREELKRSHEVRCVSLSAILQRFQRSLYFVKIDVEGMDRVLVRDILQLPRKVPYISFEQHMFHTGPDELAAFLAEMVEHGYVEFCLYKQGHAQERAVYPTREGRYFPAVFNVTTSGNFGRDLDGPWLTAEGVVTRFAERHRGAHAGLHRFEWFDIHARSGPSRPGRRSGSL
jgi:FkbM family methyltransferase